MQIKVNIKKLDETYILVKRRSKRDFFFRGFGRRATPLGHKAAILTTLEEAQKTCVSANQGKFRPLFKVKKASSYFASKWNLNYNSYSSELEVTNSPIALSKVCTTKESQKDTLTRQKEEVLIRIKRNIEDSIRRLEQAKQDVLYKEKNLIEQKAFLDTVAAFDYVGTVEANTTESERTAELLYGKT